MSSDDIGALGGSFGAKVARMVADATVHGQSKMAGNKNALAQKVLGDFTNHVSDEVRSVMGPLWRKMAEDPNVPEEIKPLLHALGSMRGQAWAWIGGSATGAALGAGLIDLLNNLLAPVIQPLIAADPNATLPPDVAAAAQVRGFGWHGERATLEYDAQAGGIDRKRWRVMQLLSETHPTIDQLQEMWRRNMLNPGDFTGTVKALGIPDKWYERLLELAQYEYSMADISAMWNRSVLSDSQADFYGKRAGYTSEQIRNYLELGGEPLSPQDLGEAFRRKMINEERFNRGIVQGPLRNEWFDVLRQLQYKRMSVVDAADAVNQGHMSESEGRSIAEANGLDANDFGTLLLTAGQPPGIAFAQEALNRGEITKQEFDTMFLESRIKNRYLNLLYRMRIRVIPQETARLMYRNGVYSREKALATLQADGYSAEDAAALLLLEETRTTSDTKDLTRAQIMSLYADRMITREDAYSMLTGIGYAPADAAVLVELADLQRIQKFVNSAVTRIRSAYLAGRMSETDASVQLDALHVPVEQRDDMLAIWDIDRTTISKTLTASQIRQAVKKDLMTEDDAIYRLVSQGYDQSDAVLFLQLTS